MKKSPVNKKTKKKVVTTSNNADEKKRSVKVYRKDGTLKSETTSRRGNAGFDKKGTYKGSTKKETRYTGSPRTLRTKAVEIDVKDPSTRSYTKYKKDGTVKKQLKAESTAGKNENAKKIARKGRKDARGAKTVSAKDIKIKRSPAKMKSPAKKPLVGKQKSLPKELQQAILKSPGKMLTKSAIKMMDKSPAKKMKINPIEEGSTSRKERVKLGRRKNKIVETIKSKSPDGPNVTTKTKTVFDKKTGNTKQVQKKKVGNKTVKKLKTNSPMNMKTPMKKSKQKVEQDYARNAIADYKSGKTKEAKYEKKKALEVAAGESPAKMDRKNVRKAKKVAKQVGKAAQAKSLLSSSNKLRDFSADNKGAKKLEKKSMKQHDAAKKLRQSGYKSSAMMKTPMEMKKSPGMMKTNQSGGGYAAKNPAAPARQLKKLGSILSKHMKSN